MILISFFSTVLPLEDPVLKFLLILLITLLAPIVFGWMKIPSLLGLIIAGAIIGPYGFNVIERDSSIILSGTAGLLYIMFLAGLEIDLVEFRKNGKKSFVFGMYTFLIPMGIGTMVGINILEFSWPSSVLLASMFASHTLLTYPLISKMGVSKNRAVNIAVGGTIITDTLALLVLAVIVGMSTQEIGAAYFIQFTIGILLFGAVVLFVFPIIGRWFLRRVKDSVSQYIFVLVMVYCGAVCAVFAGLEPIIGAFLSGLALNKLIPNTSALMNRVEFVGNAIFIPFFLIGVGMLVNFNVLITDIKNIEVAVIMTIVATFSKFLAAWLTQKTFRFSRTERQLIFGLSNSQAAATLAAVLVGYNLGILNESVLNGTIVMILVTCTISSFVSQNGAKNQILNDRIQENESLDTDDLDENILVSVQNLMETEALLSLGMNLRKQKSKRPIHVLCVIDDENRLNNKEAVKILDSSVHYASGSDLELNPILRYDSNLYKGISNAIKENKISELVLPMEELANQTRWEKELNGIKPTIYLHDEKAPIETIKKYSIFLSEKAEREIGFPFWLIQLWNLSKNTGAKLHFHGSISCLNIVENVLEKHPISFKCSPIESNDSIPQLFAKMTISDCAVFVMSQSNGVSYDGFMLDALNIFQDKKKEVSCIAIYPIQVEDANKMDLNNPTLVEPMALLDEITKGIIALFKRK